MAIVNKVTLIWVDSTYSQATFFNSAATAFSVTLLAGVGSLLTSEKINVVCSVLTCTENRPPSLNSTCRRQSVLVSAGQTCDRP